MTVPEILMTLGTLVTIWALYTVLKDKNIV